ncbi:phage antirepressor KilAC domain-containing protein [Clostridium perfringens]|uniref:phage antirepressor n=1 Tax=Clostridium perfringens TaxID=1502 RepID=UPI001CC9F899|nr:phage antirepressor KilAC domain-containing protein [Clostridium perfringens]ELC8346231.1 phage antirepressor KilAC domain-containing protein [Clostridium perfringens]MDJ8946417.1 phage antirepressor KilAC domain-containing protein [Clostridium perfringens]MDK0582045.1 phage antirepressor KilAC domain-containing protein [Clostridium perfringens]MDU1112447.1 BRO family protein [Clostridium perfringens]MDU1595136.1 BRO family protein [Clostridium perfringens]
MSVKAIDEDVLLVKIIDERAVLGKDFKVYGTTENPLFLAKDVANWIEYDSTQIKKMISKVDEEEKVRNNVTTPGGIQNTWFLTEDGVYEVLMQSRKPIAKEFKKEVKKILKQIRLTGGAVRNEEEFIKNYFPSFSDEVKQAMVLDLRKQNEKIQKELEEKNKFINQIAISKNSLKVAEVAQIASKNGIKIGQNRLWAKLREWGLIKESSKYDPKQRYIDCGYFEIVEGAKETYKGVFTYKTTKVTGKGQIYIIDKLLKEVS